MSMYWSKNENDNKTKNIFIFLKDVEDDLKEAFDGKLSAQLHKVKYTSSIKDTMSSVSRILSESNYTLEEKDKDLYKDKEEISTFVSSRYKFVISSEKNFIRLFDIYMSEFFPVKVYPNWDFDGNNTSFIEVHDEQEFEKTIISLTKSEFVRNVITKMLDNLNSN